MSVSGASISVSVTEAGDIKAYYIGGRELLEGKLNFIMPSASTMKRMNEDLTDRALKNIDRRKQVDKEYNYGYHVRRQNSICYDVLLLKTFKI